MNKIYNKKRAWIFNSVFVLPSIASDPDPIMFLFLYKYCATRNHNENRAEKS